jgi:TonB family protein
MPSPAPSFRRYLPAVVVCLAVTAVVIGLVIRNRQPAPPPPPDSAPPELLQQTLATYPAAMARLGIDGQVTLAFTVDTQGRPVRPRVASLSNPGFVHAALQALESCTFKPGTKDGKPVEAELDLSFAFQIARDGAGPATGLWTVQAPATWDPSVAENFRFDQPPRLLGTAFAVYPRAQLTAGQRARVDMGLVIDPAGRITRMTVLNADAPDWAVLAARAMYGSWKLEPARRGGQPCFAGVRTSVEFIPDGTGTVPVSPAVTELFRELTKAQPAVVQLANLDEPPHPYVQNQPAPDWVPAEQARGRVVIDYFIDPAGDVLIPAVVSAPHPELGAFAAQTVQGWVFAPPRRNGQAITAHATAVFDY